MKLIIGLGNPGKKYEGTRHSVGFACIDLLREKLQLEDFVLSEKWHSLVSRGMHGGQKIILAKPHTFMNESGSAVSALFTFFKCLPEDLWLVYDDIDLPLGTIRTRKSGSAGTHNGMRSVISSLGFQNFPRVRIGIESRGVSAAQEQDITSFVLSKFLPEERTEVESALEKASSVILTCLTPPN